MRSFDDEAAGGLRGNGSRTGGAEAGVAGEEGERGGRGDGQTREDGGEGRHRHDCRIAATIAAKLGVCED